MMRIMKLGLIAVLGLAPFAHGQQSGDSAWRQEVEKKLDILTRELERSRLGEVAEVTYESAMGLGPAASKVYRIKKGVSVSGYGEMVMQDYKAKKDDGTASGKKRQLDFLRLVMYYGYKFTDKILFNSEIEFEHATSGKRGEVGVEFAYLDFKFHPALGIRVGMMLVPMGLINELHEPTIFHGANRPSVENKIFPTTWRDNGVGLFGDIGPFAYRTYLMAGLQAVTDKVPVTVTDTAVKVKGFNASSGLREGRSKGSKSLAEDLAWVGRLDYTGLPGVMLGGSVYSGKSGQNATNALGEDIDAAVTFWDVHVSAEHRGLELSGLYAQGTIGDVADINVANSLTGNKSVGERLFGGYVQVAFDVLSLTGSKQYLAPFLRYERYDTQKRVPAGFSKNPANSRVEYTYGLTYKPHHNVVVKADWQDMNNQAGTGVDQFNLAVGYLF